MPFPVRLNLVNSIKIFCRSSIYLLRENGYFSGKKKEKFINVGVAEQTMIGVCWVSDDGKKPFAYTISTFHYIDLLK